MENSITNNGNKVGAFSCGSTNTSKKRTLDVKSKLIATLAANNSLSITTEEHLGNLAKLSYTIDLISGKEEKIEGYEYDYHHQMMSHITVPKNYDCGNFN